MAEWIWEEASREVGADHEIPDSPLKSMRWARTWKPSDEHPKRKQRESQIRDLGLSASRSDGSECVVAITVKISKDAHTPVDSIQGDGHVRALDEIACAMKVLLGSAVEVAKVVHGRGNAPRSWWLSVHRFLTSQNGRRTRTDPTIWWQCTLTNSPSLALLAKTLTKLKNSLREKFRWESLNTQGVRVHKEEDHMILLDHLSYVSIGIDLIAVNPDR